MPCAVTTLYSTPRRELSACGRYQHRCWKVRPPCACTLRARGAPMPYISSWHPERGACRLSASGGIPTSWVPELAPASLLLGRQCLRVSAPAGADTLSLLATTPWGSPSSYDVERRH